MAEDKIFILHSAAAEFTASEYFLKNEWMTELTDEIKRIVRYAQYCLIHDQINANEIVNLSTQIKAWRNSYPELIDELAPSLLIRENLGTRLNTSVFAGFLLKNKSNLIVKPYIYSAITIISEAIGLADLHVVGKRAIISRASQHMSLKIAQLHLLTVLLRCLHDGTDYEDIFTSAIKIFFNGKKQL